MCNKSIVGLPKSITKAEKDKMLCKNCAYIYENRNSYSYGAEYDCLYSRPSHRTKPELFCHEFTEVREG
jgi:hypothetical protein